MGDCSGKLLNRSFAITHDALACPTKLWSLSHWCLIYLMPSYVMAVETQPSFVIISTVSEPRGLRYSFQSIYLWFIKCSIILMLLLTTARKGKLLSSVKKKIKLSQLVRNENKCNHSTLLADFILKNVFWFLPFTGSSRKWRGNNHCSLSTSMTNNFQIVLFICYHFFFFLAGDLWVTSCHNCWWTIIDMSPLPPCWWASQTQDIAAAIWLCWHPSSPDYPQ